jgi:hypothetical protein
MDDRTTVVIAGELANSRKVTGMPADDYHHCIDIQSCSLLKPMLVSPAHYKAQFFEPPTTTKAKDFGTLIHTLVLEPQSFASRYAIYPGIKDGRDTAFKAFAAAHPGLTVIDDVSLREASQLAGAILERRFRGRPIADYLAEGEKEVTVFYTDPSTRVPCRVRMDLLHPEFVFDLKTALSVARADWLRQAMGLHYDLQCYMYSQAECLCAGRESALPFVFIAAENMPPHSVSVFTAGESFITSGAQKYQQALTAFAACRQVDLWPGLGQEDTLELDPWMAAAASAEPEWRSGLAQS